MEFVESPPLADSLVLKEKTASVHSDMLEFNGVTRQLLGVSEPG